MAEASELGAISVVGDHQQQIHKVQITSAMSGGWCVPVPPVAEGAADAGAIVLVSRARWAIS